MNKIYQGSCFKLIKDLPDNSIDLIVTSPPYANIKSYGKDINVLHPDDYVDWILPLFNSINRVLKPSGSFILNIDDKCVKKKRHTYVFDLIVRSVKETDIQLYDYYIWVKKNFKPNGSQKRVHHKTEWLLHYVKDVKELKWNMDRVRIPYKEESIKRYKSMIALDYITDIDGKKIIGKRSKRVAHEGGRIPGNVFAFPTNSAMRGNEHPAPFNVEIPTWFIKALTDEGDVVLDPFMGSGTTAEAAIKLDRQWIGFELNELYVKQTQDRVKSLFQYTL